MDDSAVQTALCVIGHPIAGNPAQFCIQRALAAMGLEWQCLSFDVAAEALPRAIAGIDVLRFAGGLIAAPHHATVVPLLAAAAADPQSPAPDRQSPALPSSALPSSAPVGPAWIDGLRRDEQGNLVGCNFLGDAFAQRLQRHEQQIGQPLRHAIYLGTAESYVALVAPFESHLPQSCYVVGETGLQAWPNDAVSPSADEPAGAAAPSAGGEASGSKAVGHEETVSANPGVDPPSPTPLQKSSGNGAAQGGLSTEAAEPAPAAPDRPTAPETSTAPGSESGGDDDDPLQGPVLVFRLRTAASQGSKGGTKSAPPHAATIAAALRRLHPDSLQIELSPRGDDDWQTLLVRSDGSGAVVTPLELEIGRIAVAIRQWSGREPDRELLAEAIEEYLEI